MVFQRLLVVQQIMDMRKFSFLFFVLYLGLGTSILGSQDRAYTQYTTHDGLAQIQVLTVHQSPSGLIYFGTKNGISVYDGNTFNSLEIDGKNISGEIYQILEHPKSGIYFKSKSKVYYYNGRSADLIYTSKELTRHALYLSPLGHLFILDNSKVVELFNNKVVRTLSLNKKFSFFSSLVEYNNRLFYLDRDRIDHIDKDSISLVYQGEENSIFTILELEEKPYLYERIIPYDQNKSNVYRIRSLENFDIHAELSIDLNTGKCEITYVENNFKFQYLMSFVHLNNAYIISENGIHKINEEALVTPNQGIFDFDKNIWIPTENGVFQYRNYPFKNFKNDELKNIWSIDFIDDDRFIHSSYSNGVGLYSLKENKSVKLSPVAIDRAWYFINSFDGKFHYLPRHNGIHQLNKNREFKKVTDRITLFTHFDKVENTIIGGIKNGISSYDITSDQSVYYEDPEVVKSYPTSLVKIDNYYLLTSYSGLYKYSIKQNLFSKIDTVATISSHVDHYGNIWVSGKKGVYLYNREREKLNKLNGFDNRSYYLSITSFKDKLFVGSGTEIYMIDLNAFERDSSLTIKTYNHRNGMMCEEIAQGGLKVHNDKIWIPSATMLTSARINELTFDTSFSNIVISLINGEGIAFGQDSVILNENDLRINFSNIGFNATSISKYKWRLSKNRKCEFTEWNSDDFAYLTDLSRGTYLFEVESRNSSFNLGANPRAFINIIIDIPVYKNPNFYIYALSLILLFMFALIYALNKYYKNRLEVDKSQHELEELKLNQAQKEIKILNQQKKLASLEVATAQAQLDPHFFSNILNALKGVINSGEVSMAEKYLLDFSKLIRGFLETSISTSNSLEHKLIDNEITIEKEQELLEAYLELMLILYKDEFDYKITVTNEDLLSVTLPPMLTQPFVENAIEHGIHPKCEKGFIEIRFSGNEDRIVCEVIDDGIGVDRSRQVKAKSIGKHKSRSTEIMKRRIKYLNELDYQIEYRIKDHLPQGTHVILIIEFS